MKKEESIKFPDQSNDIGSQSGNKLIGWQRKAIVVNNIFMTFMELNSTF